MLGQVTERPHSLKSGTAPLELNADGDGFNVPEANTEESLEVRFPRVCRGPQGMACMERGVRDPSTGSGQA